MDLSAVFRRSFHIISPVFLSYYIIPEQLGGGKDVVGPATDQYALGVTSHLQTAIVGEISTLLRFQCVLLSFFA